MKILVILFLIASSLMAKRNHHESYYQSYFCDRVNGVQEYVLDDKTRVDCLTEDHAIEVDFADKFYEAIGQSLYYGLKTNRQPAIYLIMEANSDKKYLKKLRLVANKYNIQLFYILDLR